MKGNEMLFFLTGDFERVISTEGESRPLILIRYNILELGRRTLFILVFFERRCVCVFVVQLQSGIIFMEMHSSKAKRVTN